MLVNILSDQISYLKKGYIVKDLFSNNQEFNKIANQLKTHIEIYYNKNFQNLKKLGGFKSGNLNFISKKYSNEIIEILNKNHFKNYFNFITQDDINNYEIILGGNINLPNSKNQFFHTDGKWDPRMIIVNVVTSNISLDNGPIEIIESSHKNKLPYWKFSFKLLLLPKKKICLNKGHIIIREHRLWHRGTSNKSNNLREMIGIMFIKKKVNIIEDKDSKKNLIYIFSNIFGNSKKEQIKEYIFIKFRFILFLYKFFVSILR